MNNSPTRASPMRSEASICASRVQADILPVKIRSPPMTAMSRCNRI